MRIARGAGRAAAAAALALAAGCAGPGRTLVVVVPSAGGHVGGVVVGEGAGQQVLDGAWEAAWAREGGVEATTLTPQDVDRRFAEARAARPLAPRSFTILFREGSSRITDGAESVVEQIFAEIARRPAAEVTVIGHTDRIGYRADNDRLSRERAGRVRRELVRLGIAATTIRIAGRGEREPVVATADEVAEPRNRRVEISIR